MFFHLGVFSIVGYLPHAHRPLRCCVLCVAAQAQEADIAERNREIEAKKEGWRQELLRNDKNLSDAALSVRTRDRKIINLNDQVSHTQDKQQ